MSKPNVTRVHSATQWTASVHTLHMSKPNVTRVQSATQWIASVHTLHMSKPNVTRVQSATQWIASVHTLRTSKPNVTQQPNSTVKYTCIYEPGNGDGRTQLQQTFAKKRQWHTCARKTPEKRERQNGNRNCSETQVLNKNAKKRVKFQALQQYVSFTKYCVYH